MGNWVIDIITQLLNYLITNPAAIQLFPSLISPFFVPFSLIFPPFGQNMLNLAPSFVIVIHTNISIQTRRLAVRQFTHLIL